MQLLYQGISIRKGLPSFFRNDGAGGSWKKGGWLALKRISSFRCGAIAFLVLLLVFVFGFVGYGSLSGDWENNLYLSPDVNPVISSFKSTLEVNYSSGGINYSSLSKFNLDSYKLQKFGTDFSVGLLSADSTLSFDPSNTRMNYWLAKAGMTFGGVEIDNTFVLEYLKKSSEYGAGYQLSLSGETKKGINIYLDNYFGMEKNQAEALGLVNGSGYTIVTDGGTYGPSELQYVGTTVEVTGLSFDCCQFHNTTKITESNGFEYSLFEFDIESTNLPLELEADLRFTPQTKSLKLKPRLDLDWACFDVYTNLSTSDDENLLVGGQNSTIEALAIEGFGMTDVQLGTVTFSSLTAMDGNLFRLTTESNLGLRADDYVLNPDPAYSGLYTETNYDEVVSIEKSGGDLPLTLGIDTYFNMDSETNPFDFGLFTGSAEYKFSDQFSLGAAIAVEPDQFKTMRLSFDYSF